MNIIENRIKKLQFELEEIRDRKRILDMERKVIFEKMENDDPDLFMDYIEMATNVKMQQDKLEAKYNTKKGTLEFLHKLSGKEIAE